MKILQPTEMRQQLYLLLLGCLFCLANPSLFAQAPVLNVFNVTNQGTGIRLDWEVQDMTSITEFRIFRKSGSEANFGYVATIPANSTSAYTYTDNDAFRTESTTLITYQLKVVKSGMIFPFERTFTHSTTAIRQTWGSIKSMFR